MHNQKSPNLPHSHRIVRQPPRRGTALAARVADPEVGRDRQSLATATNVWTVQLFLGKEICEETSQKEMCCGEIVCIHSLLGATSKLKGKHGELMEYKKDQKRWVVKVCDSGKVINVITLDIVCRPYRFNVNTGKSCNKRAASSFPKEMNT